MWRLRREFLDEVRHHSGKIVVQYEDVPAGRRDGRTHRQILKVNREHGLTRGPRAVLW